MVSRMFALSYDANPARMEFSERTGTEWPEVTHLGAPHPACDRQPEFHSQFGELIRAAVTAAVGGPNHAVTKGTTQPRWLGRCRELPTQPPSLAATSCGSQHFTAAAPR